MILKIVQDYLEMFEADQHTLNMLPQCLVVSSSLTDDKMYERNLNLSVIFSEKSQLLLHRKHRTNHILAKEARSSSSNCEIGFGTPKTVCKASTREVEDTAVPKLSSKFFIVSASS